MAVSLLSCTKSEEPQKGLKKFRVLLDWTPNTNHTGLFVAKEKGFFEEKGLDVEIVSADGGNTLELLATGSGDVGISFQEYVTAARAANPPIAVKAIAAILQDNTAGYVSLKDKNINTPKDLEGKTYGGYGSDVETAFLKALCEKGGADFSKINVKTINALDTLTMIKKEADFGMIFYGWEGIIAKRQGMDINYMPLKEIDDGMDFYSPLFATSDDTIANKKDELTAFLEGAQKGYEFCKENPSEAVEILYNQNKDLDKEMLLESQKYINEHSFTADGKWGVMDTKVFDRFTKFLFDQKVIEAMPKTEDLCDTQLLTVK